MSVNEELLPLRNKIDGLDSELVRLLNERAEVAKEIGEIKARAGLPVYRPEREAEVLKKICGKNEGPLPNESLVAIWREVMCACRGLESGLPRSSRNVQRTGDDSSVRLRCGRNALWQYRRGL